MKKTLGMTALLLGMMVATGTLKDSDFGPSASSSNLAAIEKPIPVAIGQTTWVKGTEMVVWQPPVEDKKKKKRWWLWGYDHEPAPSALG